MLKLIHIGKRYGSQTAVHDINLTIGEGEFFSLLGPSGCGKTTLMRMIAGLETVSEGEIWLDDQRIDHLPPQKRPFNMVFQKYALFPHLSVADNVAFGLRIQKVGSEEIRLRVSESLALVGMGTFADRLPETLSGGQQQRVALARALVNRPKVLLLDEPLSALDQKLREHMQTELRALQRRLGLIFIFVTHDQEEALVLSDRIGVMNAGHMEEVGTPRALYADPRSIFTAGFVGHRNALSGEWDSEEGDQHIFRLRQGGLLRGISSGFDSANRGDLLHAFIRPERIRVSAPGQGGDAQNQLHGKVLHRVFRGVNTELDIEVAPGALVCAYISEGESTDPSLLEVGANVCVSFSPEDVLLFHGAET